MSDNSQVVAVWSSYGHRFITENGHEQCLTCGAIYDLVPDEDDPTHGEYVTMTGDEPTYCTGDTQMVHGPREDRRALDPHSQHQCNCHLCQ